MIPKVTHSGQLKIGKKELDCAVLEDGTRVISRNAIFRAFGRTKRGRASYEQRVPNMPSFIDANNLQPFINNDLMGGLKPLEYLNKSGRKTTGFKAEIIPMLCDVYLEARKQDALTKKQLPLAVASEIIVRSLSKIGIIALVDEATGYQEIRDRLALQKILEMYYRFEKSKASGITRKKIMDELNKSRKMINRIVKGRNQRKINVEKEIENLVADNLYD